MCLRQDNFFVILIYNFHSIFPIYSSSTDRETKTEAENNLPKVVSGTAQVEHRPQEARAPADTLRMRAPIMMRPEKPTTTWQS